MPSEQPFRTLVVVPESHTDGTFERLCGPRRGQGKVSCKDSSVARRAVQLDLRPIKGLEHESVVVAWDSRVVHQGHTHVPQSECRTGWHPPLYQPRLFQLDDLQAWRNWVTETGYVAIADIIPKEEINEALCWLLSDLKMLVPQLEKLEDVREDHLPRSSGANDLRTGAGLCHGEFAWFLRSHPRVNRFFELLFGLSEGTPMIGSVDVVALAPPHSAATRGMSGKQWLHLDYTPPSGRLFQACVQIYPKHGVDGCGWERIGVMLCKAPATHPPNLTVQRSLLACCVAGAASRATAGVTQGLAHAASQDPPAQGTRRLLPGLVDLPLCAAERLGEGASAVEFLRWLTPWQILQCCDLATLYRIVPPRVLRHVAPMISLGFAHDQASEGPGLMQALARQMAFQNASAIGRRQARRAVAKLKNEHSEKKVRAKSDSKEKGSKKKVSKAIQLAICDFESAVNAAARNPAAEHPENKTGIVGATSQGPRKGTAMAQLVAALKRRRASGNTLLPAPSLLRRRPPAAATPVLAKAVGIDGADASASASSSSSSSSRSRSRSRRSDDTRSSSSERCGASQGSGPNGSRSRSRSSSSSSSSSSNSSEPQNCLSNGSVTNAATTRQQWPMCGQPPLANEGEPLHTVPGQSLSGPRADQPVHAKRDKREAILLKMNDLLAVLPATSAREFVNTCLSKEQRADLSAYMHSKGDAKPARQPMTDSQQVKIIAKLRQVAELWMKEIILPQQQPKAKSAAEVRACQKEQRLRERRREQLEREERKRAAAERKRVEEERKKRLKWMRSADLTMEDIMGKQRVAASHMAPAC